MGGQIGESRLPISHGGKGISCLGLSLLVLKATVLVRESGPSSMLIQFTPSFESNV